MENGKNSLEKRKNEKRKKKNYGPDIVVQTNKSGPSNYFDKKRKENKKIRTKSPIKRIKYFSSGSKEADDLEKNLLRQLSMEWS